LHYALQKHLGKHAQQQGSKVERDALRFDFTNPTAITREQLAVIEAEVNEQINAAQPIQWTSLPIAEARQAGAMMLFGEKYPDVVRMVSMGEFSKELCGGTHLDSTSQVGLFRIVAEESVSAGTRRISALTGEGALAAMRRSEALLAETAATLKVPVGEVPARVAALAKEVRDLKKQLSGGARSGAVSADQLIASAVEVGKTRLVVSDIPGAGADELRLLIDQVRKKTGSAAILLTSHGEGKVVLVAGISRDLQDRGLNAGEWIKTTAAAVGGSGGGRPDMAQAGGKDPEKLPAALDQARKTMQEKLAG
jgi:alanyl-tRNA synthetase